MCENNMSISYFIKGVARIIHSFLVHIGAFATILLLLSGAWVPAAFYAVITLLLSYSSFLRFIKHSKIRDRIREQGVGAVKPSKSGTKRFIKSFLRHALIVCVYLGTLTVLVLVLSGEWGLALIIAGMTAILGLPLVSYPSKHPTTHADKQEQSLNGGIPGTDSSEGFLINRPDKLVQGVTARRRMGNTLNANYAGRRSGIYDSRAEWGENTLNANYPDSHMLPPSTALSPPLHDTSGTVYLMKSGEFYKIGMTRGSVENRLKRLQTGSPNQIKLIHTIKTDDPNDLETYFHNLFKNKRAYGEWFRLDERDVALVCGFQVDTKKPKQPPLSTQQAISTGTTDLGSTTHLVTGEQIHAFQVSIICPKCRRGHSQTLNKERSKYVLLCPHCNRTFTSLVGKVKRKRSRKESGTNRRHFSIRFIGLDKTERLVEFTNSSNEDFELTARDSIVISYIDGKVKLVENKTINRAWKVSEPGCYIATYLYGPTSPEVQLLRDFRDNVLLQAQWSANLVQAYYRISPTLIDKFGHGRLFRLCSLMLTRSVLWFIRQWPDRKHWVDRSAHRKAPR